MKPDSAVLRFRVASALGAAGLVLWAVWWFIGLRDFELPLAGKTWLQFPAFGADFWSQSEYAARLWYSGGDPYASRGHLFHYPPIVIRAFLWVNLFSQAAALRIWVITLILLLTGAAVVAHRTRKKLGLWTPPVTLSVLLVLVSFPVIFQLERSNFDLLTLAAILISLPLFSRETPGAEFLAGCVLSIGPWVKLYPGLIGLGLVALRKKWAVLGFGVAGALIFLVAPTETKHSFEVLGIQMARIRAFSAVGPYPAWSHSLSLAWLQIAHSISQTPSLSWVAKIPESGVAGAIVFGGIFAVCLRCYRQRARPDILYPLLLWICATASCAHIIANDYSLAFYPLAVVAAVDVYDPWSVRIGILSSLLSWQPFVVPISTWLVFLSKLLGLAAVGVSLWRRASER